MRVNLYCPPPVTSVHLIIHMAFAVTISVVVLRDIDQVTHKLGISVKSLNTLEDIVVQRNAQQTRSNAHLVERLRAWL